VTGRAGVSYDEESKIVAVQYRLGSENFWKERKPVKVERGKPSDVARSQVPTLDSTFYLSFGVLNEWHEGIFASNELDIAVTITRVVLKFCISDVKQEERSCAWKMRVTARAIVKSETVERNYQE